jgi:energy-coupling factor transport system ATP-binding protein
LTEPPEPVVAFVGFGFRHVAADRAALADVSLEVRAGEYVGVLGATGAGVTTLLTAMDGVVPQLVRGETSGSITVLGRDPTVVPVHQLARDVGLVFDDPTLAATQASVAEEVAFGLENLGMPRAEMDVPIGAALASVGLAGLASRDPATLSGGELGRLAIACALATGPGILVLDGPSTNLDPAGRRAVYGVLRRLNREQGVTVVVADQDAEGIAEDATRVVVLDGGRVVGDGRPEDVLGEPAALRRHGVSSTGAAELAEALGVPVPVPTSVAAVAARLSALPAADSVVIPDAEPPDATPVVELSAVAYRYPGAVREAVVEAALRVRAGEVVGLVGANGSGKTTLGRLVNGLLRPQRGTVTVDGLSTSAHPLRTLAAHVGSVFQDPTNQLFASTVAEELALGPRALGMPEAEIAQRVRDWAAALGLGDVLGSHPQRLGRAERRLVALGATLAMGPRVLVLDEPTTGADARLARVIEAQIRSVAGQRSAVLVASHDMAFLGRVAARLVVMDQGRILADAPTRQVFADAPLLAAAGLEAPPVTRVALAVERSRPGLWPPVSLEEGIAWLRAAVAPEASAEEASR